MLVAAISRFRTPGSGYSPLLIVAISITMARAVRKQAQQGEAQVG